MTGEPNDITVALADGVAVLTLNRPERSNAIHPAMGRRYVELLDELDREPEARVLVLTGAGERFCGGADLEFLSIPPEQFRERTLPADQMPDAALRIRKPVIAAVNGPSFGIGVAYALASDIRFASRTATFDPAFARLGLAAEYNVSWLLQRLVGLGRAAEILLSGRRVDAAEACAIGLVHRVLAPDELLGEVMTYARAMARTCSPRAMATIKRQLWADAERARAGAAERSWAEMVAGFAAPDLWEAVAARSERRDPRFPPLPQEES